MAGLAAETSLATFRAWASVCEADGDAIPVVITVPEPAAAEWRLGESIISWWSRDGVLAPPTVVDVDVVDGPGVTTAGEAGVIPEGPVADAPTATVSGRLRADCRASEA